MATIIRSLRDQRVAQFDCVWSCETGAVGLRQKIGSLLYGVGMNILTDNARSAVFRDGQIVVQMASGAEIRFPVAANPRLARGSAAQLNRIEISPFGLHWPDLDEDLSLRGLLAGEHGQSGQGKR